MREPSTYGCDVSHFRPSSRSRSSPSPMRLYDVQADSAPLPLALRLSQIQTMTPCCARNWWNRYVRAAPRVAHLLRVRAGVGVLVDRILLRRIEVGRLDHHRFHDEAVARLHLHELRLRRCADRASAAPRSRRRRERACRRRDSSDVDGGVATSRERVEIRRHRRIEVRVVLARRLGQPLQAAAVEVEAIEVAAEDGALGAGEIDPVVGCVDAVQRAHFPRAVGELRDQLSVGGVVIEVLESGALAEPEERAVLQPDRIAGRRRPTPSSSRGRASSARRRRERPRHSDRARSARDSGSGRRPSRCPATSRRGR